MREINKIIIHCSDTPDYEPDDVDFDKYGKNEIDRWHKARGFDCIGYHYVVKRSGKIQKGRNEEVIGAHCLNHNKDSIGICYIGKYTPTSMQIAALYSLCVEIMLKYDLDFSDIFGHYTFNGSKSCPGFDIQRLLRQFWQYRTIPW